MIKFHYFKFTFVIQCIKTISLCHCTYFLKIMDLIFLQLVSEYLVQNRDQTELHIIACRLLLDIMPGLETSVVFQENVRIIEYHSECLAFPTVLFKFHKLRLGWD